MKMPAQLEGLAIATEKRIADRERRSRQKRA
jgi:hypothetical protein